MSSISQLEDVPDEHGLEALLCHFVALDGSVLWSEIFHECDHLYCLGGRLNSHMLSSGRLGPDDCYKLQFQPGRRGRRSADGTTHTRSGQLFMVEGVQRTDDRQVFITAIKVPWWMRSRLGLCSNIASDLRCRASLAWVATACGDIAGFRVRYCGGSG